MSCSGSVADLQKRLLNFWIPPSTSTPPIPVSSAAICTPPPPPPSLLWSPPPPPRVPRVPLLLLPLPTCASDVRWVTT